ncbi:HAD hydrolase-like protein [Lysinibacillus sp. UGB7]|uniref:HAD hydrolase-like protein n=1 Tax=Lysinibacillus sp. UGB7 TaxID=3411039 RepID=UPI003B828EAD
MYMCTRDVSDITVIADFTGTPDFFSNPNFIIGFNKMVSLNDTILISTNSISLIEGNRVIQEISSEIEINVENIFINLKLHEADTIVITNNKDKIKSWIDINVSVLFIAERDEDQLILNNNYMPDAIWSIDQFANDIENLNSNLYYMEHIGEESIGGATYYKLPLYNEYAQVEYDTVFLGRYFKVQDGRHYIHPLSRTILDFKSIVRGDRILASRHVIFEYLNIIIKHFIDESQDITYITAVPPRPNQQHRFYGFEQFYDGTAPLNFQLLNTVRPYESPKYSRGGYEKYQCVEGVFECTENIQGHVLLIDDIFTSGSTVSECVRVLERNGADKVTVIPLAHTQYLPKSDFKWLDGKFDDNGNEYKLKINKTTKSAFWAREQLRGTKDHDEIVEYYNNQNRFEFNNEPPYILNCEEDEIQGIIFDLDNTLIETTDLEFYRKNHRGLTTEIVLENSTPLVEVDLVNELKRSGFKIGVVTRSREEYAKPVLDAYGYEYDILISRYSTYRTKPHQDPYISCMKKMEIDSRYLISIGNEEVDTISSNRAGIYCYEIGDNASLEQITQLLNSILEYRLIG